MKKMTYEEKLVENDPFYTEGFNDGLEYSAKWIRNSASGLSEEVCEFAELNAQSLQASEREIKQQNYLDAIKADPDMYVTLEKDRDEILTTLQLVLDNCDWLNGLCRTNEQVGAVLPKVILKRAHNALTKKRITYFRG